MHGSSAKPAERALVREGLYPRLLALAAVGAMAAACTPPEATDQPPLRPFAQPQPGPDASSMEAREQRILEEYERSGQIPMEEPVVGEEPDGEPLIGDDILGVLVPDPGEEAEGADAPGALAAPNGDAFHVATPEGLGAEVFRAMVTQDSSHFDELLIDSVGLQALAKVKEATARTRVERLRKASHKAFRLFGVQKKSEAPEGGMASKLVYVRTRIGKGATIWGKEPRRGEDTVQYWNNAVVFRLAKEEEAIGPAVPALEEDEDEKDGTYFELALGRMLKTPNGSWRLAAAPSASGPFHVWLQAGFHLKDEMLMPEHHPFPLSVGNFWRYRVRRTGEDTPDDVLDATSEEIRIEVTEVDKYDGYRIVSLRRTHTQERKKVTNQRLLVTPRRLYFCTSYCKYKGADLGYVLGYVRINTPLLVFPTEPGMGWRTGGRRPTSSRGATYNIREALEDVTVPAGQFAETLPVAGKREVRWFKPGVGIVQRQVQTERGTRTQELLEYRVLTTE